MATLTSLNKVTLDALNKRRADAYLVDLNADGSPRVSGDGLPNARAFQYYPDTISDTKGTTYSQKDIPGGSLPLYQWSNGGERLISFTAVFSTDIDLLDTSVAADVFQLGSGSNIKQRLANAGVERSNVDIRAALAWLRQYLYPTYESGGGAAVGQTSNSSRERLTIAPKKLTLVLPNSGIGLAGSTSATPNSVRCIMTQCDTTYEAFFPTGLPRIATVQLAFAQIPQGGSKVEFPQWDDGMDRSVAGTRSSQASNTIGYNFRPGER